MPLRGIVRVALFALLLLPAGVRTAGADSPPRVYIIVVDGLDDEAPSEDLTPTLWQLVHGGKDRACFYPRARAVMPTLTNPNHVSIATGSYPAAHAISANYYWERGEKLERGFLDQASAIEVETLFTVIGRTQPKLRTAAVFGKWKLADLFSASKAQLAPTHLWGDLQADRDVPDARAGLSSDERTMDEVLRTISGHDPRLLFVNLGDVDRLSHIFGPASNEARKGILEADRQIGRLVRFLKARKLWTDAVLIVTADHGFTSTAPHSDRPYPMILFGRTLALNGFSDLFAVSNGGTESVYLRGFDPKATELDRSAAERLRAARALALEQPEIEEALYRQPNPTDGGAEHTLANAHPDWRFAHPRSGELVLVAKTGYFFNDPYTPSAGGMRGSHGGPGQITIPIVITGGYEKIRGQVVEGETQAENPDLGATAAWLLGIRQPARVTGEAVSAKGRGRVLSEAFVP